MSEAVQTVKAADAGIQSINTLIAAAKSLASSALSSDSTTATALMTQFNTVRTQINEMASDAGYKRRESARRHQRLAHGQIRRDGRLELGIAGFDGSTTSLGISLAAGWVSGTTVTASTIETAMTALDAAKDKLRTESASWPTT